VTPYYPEHSVEAIGVVIPLHCPVPHYDAPQPGVFSEVRVHLGVANDPRHTKVDLKSLTAFSIMPVFGFLQWHPFSGRWGQ